MIFKTIFIILLYLYNFTRRYGKGIELNILAHSLNIEGQPFRQNVNDFNDYSRIHQLNITLNLIIYLPNNSSADVDNFIDMVESTLKRTPEKYDLIFYDNSYTSRYGEYLLDLRHRISTDHLALFHPDLLSETCTYHDKIVGIKKDR
ncbi:hypothetical protein PIROE2DRAFT_9538 [Piromyces sp. E2]|nr:hypothetical protein PIROE2DRAFT_9538 [Piromyces sp. E2]|eukprot:OUM63868.1 hypothetical protein PIROE2DRAFT_9538 [Piromyces sp. E2]